MAGGIVQTVLGCVSAEKLGRTLTHEHLSLNFENFFVEPPEEIQSLFQNDITLGNVGIIKQYPYGSKYNVVFNDAETHAAVLKEMRIFHEFGGGTIVDNTSHGLQRNIQLMEEVQFTTGVNVIAGTGYYVASVQPQSVLNQSAESLYEVMFNELIIGCVGNPEVKCGFIGEVGSGWPLHDFEKRAIRATAEVQSALNCPVSFHPGRHPEAPFEILRLYQEAGGDTKKAVMSHLDRTLLDDDRLLDFAALGSYCQYDLFGIECSHYQLSPEIDMPSDAQRLDKVQQLLNDNKADRILLAHDIHTKHRLMEFGGHGYSHLYINIIPKMLQKGISKAIIDKITIQNPKTWLTYKQTG